jgi:hypothetical protein
MVEEFANLLREYVRPVWPAVELVWPEPMEVGEDLIWPSPPGLAVLEFVDGLAVDSVRGVLVVDTGWVLGPTSLPLSQLQQRFDNALLYGAISWLRQAIDEKNRKSQEEMARHPKLTRRITAMAEAAIVAGIVPACAITLPGPVAACASLVALRDSIKSVCEKCHEATATPSWLPVSPTPEWCPAHRNWLGSPVAKFGNWGSVSLSLCRFYFKSPTLSTSTPETTWRRYIGVGTPRSAQRVVSAILREKDRWEACNVGKR